MLQGTPPQYTQAHSTRNRRKSKLTFPSQLLIAPLTFVSFLISLSLIDTRNTSLRHHQHVPPRQPTTALGRAGASLHNLVYKPVPAGSPYAYISSPDVKGSGSSAAATATATTAKGKDQEDEPWHWRTKQRQQMKAEISDAFAVRVWVLYALVGCALSSLVGAWVIGGWMVGFVRKQVL